ncbi:MAG: type II secretion system F family protein [Opitutales bacterium]|nr:type II secretion system F family protein [Opitutales bacterium]
MPLIFWNRSQLTLREQQAWISQWRVLLEGGFGVMDALDWMARHADSRRLRGLCRHGAERLREGVLLETAFDGAGIELPTVLRSQLQAGRMGGNLGDQLKLVEDLASVRIEMGNRLGTAMAYPLTILLIGGAITLTTLMLVVPRFEDLYAQMLEGEPLPVLTQWLLASTGILRGGGDWRIGVALLLAAGLVWSLRFSPKACRIAARLADRMPVWGPWRRSGRSARFCLELAALLRNRIRLGDALAQMATGSSSASWQDLHAGLLQAQLAGQLLADALEKKRWLNPEVIALIRVGEAGGQLAAQLQQCGDWARKRQQQASERLAALAEPLLISGLSLLMGTVALALFLPIVSLIQKMSAGFF